MQSIEITYVLKRDIPADPARAITARIPTRRIVLPADRVPGWIAAMTPYMDRHYTHEVKE